MKRWGAHCCWQAVRDDDGRWHMPPRPWKLAWVTVERR